MVRISAAMIAAALAEPRVPVMRPSSESSLSALNRRLTSLSVIAAVLVELALVFCAPLIDEEQAA
jgi:hypothetical protein